MESIKQKLTASLRAASKYNRNLTVRPEVILWPDPERQWESVIPALQQDLPELLLYGEYDAEKRQGPVVWLKTQVALRFSGSETVPIIYLPGFSKQRIRRLGEASLELQPLLEYYFTGAIWQHRNGKPWTVAAFLQNEEEGMGVTIVQDVATKAALLNCLESIFEDSQLKFPQEPLNAHFFRARLFPNLVSSILTWLNEGERFWETCSKESAEIFEAVCQEQYGFAPREALRLEAARQLASQQNNWRSVWEYFANAPSKYPHVQDLLRRAKPDELGSGDYLWPEESWPQVNEEAEKKLRSGLAQLSTREAAAVLPALRALEQAHAGRRNWLWAELGEAPLARSLPPLLELAEYASRPFPSERLTDLGAWYETEGYRVDRAARRALAEVESGKDVKLIGQLIRSSYLPWLERLAETFQKLVGQDAADFGGEIAYEAADTFVLFVDALRWELGVALAENLRERGVEVQPSAHFCALPSLTPTSKPAISPVANKISTTSDFKDFRPQSIADKDMTTANFRQLLLQNGYQYLKEGEVPEAEGKYWRAIGDIDERGHGEGIKLVRRVDELFAQVIEALDLAFESGFPRVRIVTDHGWLLVPGGLPKAHLPRDLAETRWGRCALIKEGAKSKFLQIPWRWNPSIFIAYAPGVSFFKANEAYAHGGISLQECLVPSFVVKNPIASQAEGKISTHKWIHLRCKVEVEGMQGEGYIDIRTKFSDPSTSKILPENLRESNGVPLKGGKCTVMVEDSVEDQAVNIVLTDASGVILDKQVTTVGED